MRNDRRASVVAGLLLLSLSATPADAGVAHFRGVRDTIRPSGQTMIGTASTYEAVILFPPATGASGTVFNEWTNSAEDKFLAAGPSAIFGYNYPNVGSTFIASATVTTGVWHHIAFVYDGAQERIYLDGSLLMSRAANLNVGDSGGVAQVGSIARPSCNNSFIGLIDWLRISTVARYSGASFTPPSEPTGTGELNTELLYKFNEAPGSTAVTDDGAHGYTGTLGVSGCSSPTSPALCGSDPTDNDGDSIPNACDSTPGTSTTSTTTSTSTTTTVPICGDGVVQGAEACDEGAANGTASSCCTGSCTLSAPDGTPCDSGAGSCLDGQCVYPPPTPSAQLVMYTPCRPSPPCSGGVVSCDIHIYNRGPSTVHHLEVILDLTNDLQLFGPADALKVFGIGMGNAPTVTPQHVEWTADVDIPPGGHAATWVGLSVGSVGGLKTVSVTSDATDPIPGDNTVSYAITPNASCPSSDFAQKGVDPEGLFCPNTGLFYLLVFAHPGAVKANLVDTLDPCLDPTSVAALMPAPECVVVGNDVQCTDLVLDAGGRAQVSFAVKARPGCAPGSVIPNQATVDFFDGGGMHLDTHLTNAVTNTLRACEQTCGNGIDDDGDTLTDCADPDCNARPCSDGNACTATDQCVSGACQGTPTACCGDGTVQGGEACDEGAQNGTAGSCCTAACQFRAAGSACRNAAGVCDAAETCTGTSGPCPSDQRLPSGTICRASAGVCDLAESCDGVSISCPADAKSTAICRASAGPCDVAESCNGTGDTCPADGFAPSSTVCRASGGLCDLTEACTGASAACPADGMQPSGTTCRAAAGVCDLVESCTGVSASCPADVKSTAVCRPAAGPCDLAESCNGTGDTCPADGFGPTSTVCRAAAGTCDVTETCTGASAACPADGLQPSGTSCRAPAGVCDLAETCTGASGACPVDAKSTAVCRPAAGVCDLVESCDGAGNGCPADAKSTAVCRPAAGSCDVAESCNGTSDTCPADALAPTSTMCRASAGVCDVAETCTGASAACPADGFQSSATTCRPAVGVCDLLEVCTGTSAACPVDAKSTAVCRASAGTCDLAESCDGTGNACPPDAKSTAVCRPAAGVCDVAESCNGTSDTCPADTLAPTSTICRATAGGCDIAENCTGSSATCPPNGFVGAGTTCRAAAGVCDVAETCTGTAASCPPDAKSTALCRPAAGPCDQLENCNGTGNACPADLFTPTGTACPADGNPCTDDVCNGAGVCGVPHSSVAACKNGVREGTEQCDDGSPNCSNTCTCLTPGPDGDGDGVADGCDNCPSTFNPDQRNSDCNGGAGCSDGGDACDPCPARASHAMCSCDPLLSGGKNVGPAGGTLVFPAGGMPSLSSIIPKALIEVTVPPGAVCQNTTISVTERPAAGAGIALSPIHLQLRPSPFPFNVPVTVRLVWPDGDNGGAGDTNVDHGVCQFPATSTCDHDTDCVGASPNCLHPCGPFTVSEDELELKKDGVKFNSNGFGCTGLACECPANTSIATSGACSTAAANCADPDLLPGHASVAKCCMPGSNEWTFETCNFSGLIFGHHASNLIPGGGSVSTDCVSEWVVNNPDNEPEFDAKGLVSGTQTCTDGDAICDADGTANGACEFRVGVCLNNQDPRLLSGGQPACSPADVRIWEVRKPRPDSGRPVDTANAVALRDAVAALGGGTVGGIHQERVTFAPALSGGNACTSLAHVVVPLRARGTRAGRASVKGRAHMTDGTMDKDKLKLYCLPAS